MASSGNFAVFSTVTRPESGYSTSDQITGGGLSVKGPSSGSFEPCIATISPNSGKWYWEYRAGQGGGSSYGRPAIAVSEQGIVKNEDFIGGASGQKGVLFTVNDGEKRINGSDTSYGNAVSQHDIVQIALDCDNGAVYLGINNTWQNSGDPTSGSSKTGAALTAGIQNVDIDILHTRYAGGGTDQYNFGQDDTFGGAITGAGNADGNGRGVFKYAPPSGYLALCSANLPISDDIDPAQTDDDIPTKQFGIGLYTGQSGGGNSVVCGFQPDLIWGKLRSGSQTGILIDSSRGQGLLFSATTDDEQTSNGPFISSYNSDGFTFGSSGSNPNDNGGSYVAWCWRANGGTTASNSEGDITSTVQANTKAGFSIVTYTGNRTSSGVSTVGHGLSSAPDMVITKSRSNSGNWWVQHIGTSTASKMLNLQATSAETDKSGNGTLSRPTATVFGTNHTDGLGTNGETHIAYCWHSVEGYSKFGFFEGNNDDDGAFIYTGFRPRLVFIKNIDATNRWIVHDSARRTFNPMNLPLDWDESYGEYTSASRQIDFLSNGFKCRTSDASINGSNTYVYGAWGDVPFKYNNTF